MVPGAFFETGGIPIKELLPIDAVTDECTGEGEGTGAGAGVG